MSGRVVRGRRGRVTFADPEPDFGMLVALFVARVGALAALVSIMLACVVTR